ncbi:MAG TPA: gamma-glutamyltransferase, partial [Chitinophagaceae bacterium]
LIRNKGPWGFYRGETAGKIVAEMKRGGGIISLTDLKNYRAKERTPVIFDYKGYAVVSMPLPSSGGILLEQMLKILSGYPVDQWGFETLRSVQLMTEIERRAYADRARFLGDPDFVKVPVKELVSKAYLKTRMAAYNPLKASPSNEIAAGRLSGEKEETTHISVVDNDGNAVSATYTLNGIYGSKVVAGGAGFFLNDEMDDFSAKPGTPNMFGLVGAEANAIAPHKRMLSSMTPTIVLKNQRPCIVLGTPGGATIITSVFQTIVDLLDFNMTVSDAVNKPKFHEQWLPDVVFIERGFPKTVKDSMETMGYKFVERGAIGRTELIRISNGRIEAVGDHRGDDSVAGY